jgi:hypothetical protein
VPALHGAHERTVPAQSSRAARTRDEIQEPVGEFASGDAAAETTDRPSLPLTRNEPGGPA